MRAYAIEVYNADGSLMQAFNSVVNGKIDRGALQVEFDIPVTAQASPISGAGVKIWGVGIDLIKQSSDFNGKTIKVYGGLFTGLPLATKSYNLNQYGLLAQGTIYQAYGNWIGKDQWIQFVLLSNGLTDITAKQNVSFNWSAGSSLKDALQTTLSNAAPTYSISGINISPRLILPADEAGQYDNLITFAQYVKNLSQQILGTPTSTPPYLGVDILVQNGVITVSDQTQPTQNPNKQVLFTDLVGQPTYINPGEIQVTTIMRHDIQPFDIITLPNTVVTIAPGDPGTQIDKSVFSGDFVVAQARHIGNFREPDALAWISTFDCVPRSSAFASFG
jgi:hypothetical protein